MNTPRFIACVIAGCVFIFGYDFVVHHNLLNDLYQQTLDLWRPVENMEEFFPFVILRIVALSLITAYIFTRNYEGKGISEGLRFGVMLGALMGVMMASTYIWQPIPKELALGWAAAGLGNGLGLGIVFSLIYRK